MERYQELQPSHNRNEQISSDDEVDNVSKQRNANPSQHKQQAGAMSLSTTAGKSPKPTTSKRQRSISGDENAAPNVQHSCRQRRTRTARNAAAGTVPLPLPLDMSTRQTAPHINTATATTQAATNVPLSPASASSVDDDAPLSTSQSSNTPPPNSNTDSDYDSDMQREIAAALETERDEDANALRVGVVRISPQFYVEPNMEREICLLQQQRPQQAPQLRFLVPLMSPEQQRPTPGMCETISTGAPQPPTDTPQQLAYQQHTRPLLRPQVMAYSMPGAQRSPHPILLVPRAQMGMSPPLFGILHPTATTTTTATISAAATTATAATATAATATAATATAATAVTTVTSTTAPTEVNPRPQLLPVWPPPQLQVRIRLMQPQQPATSSPPVVAASGSRCNHSQGAQSNFNDATMPTGSGGDSGTANDPSVNSLAHSVNYNLDGINEAVNNFFKRRAENAVRCPNRRRGFSAQSNNDASHHRPPPVAVVRPVQRVCNSQMPHSTCTVAPFQA